ncbi:hypothetical protein [Haloferax larsenii]|uniref:Uncharacterized protein n=1 Tax=Haloferax larsenii TaxID=302484 RepID=A0A1H7L1U3_HALLR|nr:hypothetical protein [Haloferax larsenii]SEK92237.1 hypothetical protein SAMN04488691_102166 [Haloferax larsenii]
MGFKKFTRKGGKRGGSSSLGPRISLRKSGSVGLNHATIEKYFDGKDYVELFNDAVNQKVGLHPRGDETEDSYKVRKSEKEGHGGQIACKAFLREFDIVPDKTTRYEVSWDEDQELIVIDLTDPDHIYNSSK